MLINAIKDNFKQITHLLSQLSNEDYKKCHSELSNATIGEHTRHIIELYQCLLKSYDSGIVNYDLRERNLLIQSNTNYAIEIISVLLNEIEKPNKDFILQQGKNIDISVTTNYERELLFNLDHSIHHQALIKVAVLKNKSIQLDENFGVAKSTIEYRNQCVQ